MMGTGEASGSGRALQAAEAAIANPLLDETSMKGAQGLLISITGGRDLTLFEVDEAATRIREEVDPDANIILGATFDESLEGIIRVSVVATGIDRAINEAAEKNFQQISKPVIRPSAAVAPAPAAVQPAPVMQAPKAADPIAQTIRMAEAEMERELEIPAPRAAAPMQQEAFRPQSKIFAPAPEAAPVIRPAPMQQAPVSASVISQPTMSQPAPAIQQSAPVMQQPVRQTVEQVRMPKVEDFPPVVQAEIDHRSQPAASHAHEERGPMGLLKRITNSLGRREEESVASEMTAAPAAASQQRRPLSPEASLYAPRRGSLDDQGRSVPQARMMQEDDQLEIPAFLRRQSN
jgi:cell division protein FtsZ